MCQGSLPGNTAQARTRYLKDRGKQEAVTINLGSDPEMDADTLLTLLES